jgi:hypothetical protein
VHEGRRASRPVGGCGGDIRAGRHPRWATLLADGGASHVAQRER